MQELKVHAIVDYSFLYYKYKFQLDSGKMRRLTDTATGKDISQIYYSIKEIESFRRQLEAVGNSVTMSICFDMPSDRKHSTDGATEGEVAAANAYKSSRTKRLNDDDFANILIVQDLLNKAGYNTYRFEGFEADDLVANLIRMYQMEFDYNIIYTPDADLLVNISPLVGARRYKVFKGYQNVDMSNFCAYLSAEYKCSIPYNALMLFKSLCGDKSDNIAGVKGFGPKAFDKLVTNLNSLGLEWENHGSYRATQYLLEVCKGKWLTEDQYNQATESLSLVRPLIIEDDQLVYPMHKSNQQLRQGSYSIYQMTSLYE